MEPNSDGSDEAPSSSSISSDTPASQLYNDAKQRQREENERMRDVLSHLRQKTASYSHNEHYEMYPRDLIWSNFLHAQSQFPPERVTQMRPDLQLWATWLRNPPQEVRFEKVILDNPATEGGLDPKHEDTRFDIEPARAPRYDSVKQWHTQWSSSIPLDGFKIAIDPDQPPVCSAAPKFIFVRVCFMPPMPLSFTVYRQHLTRDNTTGETYVTAAVTEAGEWNYVTWPRGRVPWFMPGTEAMPVPDEICDSLGLPKKAFQGPQNENNGHQRRLEGAELDGMDTYFKKLEEG